MKRAMIAVLAAVASLAACGDEGTVGPEGRNDAITREEALALTSRLMEASEQAGVGAYESSQSSASLSASAATSSGLPKSITIDHTGSHPCPVSGRVTFELSLDVAWESKRPRHDFSFDAAGTLTPEACAFVKKDVTLTVDGEPSLGFEAHAASVGGELEPFTSAASGALSWSTSDGRSGQCVIDLAAEIDFVERQRVAQGEVCGHSIDETITWTAP